MENHASCQTLPSRKERLKAVANKTKLPVACAGTTVITAVITTKVVLAITSMHSSSQLAMLTDAVAFIENKDLWDEFLNSAKRFNR